MLKLTKEIKVKTIIVLLLALVSQIAWADITGAGATFPYPIYAKWADAYKKSTGKIGRAHV